jgi:hypothetical protein
MDIKKKLSVVFRFSRLTRILLVVFIVLVICVVFMGLDNVTGLATGWLATLTLLAIFTYRWRKIRYFLILSAASFIGGILLAFLHEEVVYPLTGWIGGTHALEGLPLAIYHQITSYIIFFFGPMGVLAGIIGALTLSIIRLISLINMKKVPQNT